MKLLVVAMLALWAAPANAGPFRTKKSHSVRPGDSSHRGGFEVTEWRSKRTGNRVKVRARSETRGLFFPARLTLRAARGENLTRSFEGGAEVYEGRNGKLKLAPFSATKSTTGQPGSQLLRTGGSVVQ